jgi:hypothetical protein
MILHRTSQKDITGSESTVFIVLGPNADGITVYLENKDASNFIVYQFQESNVNSDSEFEDLEDADGNFGTSGTLSPSGGDNPRAMVSIRTTSPFIRLRATAAGGATLSFDLSQFVASASTYFTNGVQ